jgi:uncharacterized protein (TIGR03437 family)
MQRNTKILSAKIAVGLAVIPVVILAHKAGPDPRHTGAPGDETCNIPQCHVGTPLNGGGGSVVLTTSAGTTYTPGQQQTVTITINDSKAKAYGFQLTARLDTNPTNGQAGDFTAGTQQIVLCDNPVGALKQNGQLCPANASVEFIEHSFPFPKNTLNVAWTPPSTSAGTVTLYVAANAANNDGTEMGDHIYTTQLTLCPVLSSGQAMPTIGGVQSAGGFSPKAGAAPGTWLEIFGAGFAAASCVWQGADFKGTTAPTSIGGVSVSIGGANAFVDFVSPGQANVQVPSGVGDGVPLVLTNSAGSSAPYILKTAAVAPALLAPPQAPFLVNNKQYVVAQLPDQSFVGIPSRPAKPGDILTIYGIGFGTVQPATAPGDVATQSTKLDTNATFLFGQQAVVPLYQGLAPGFVGLYQFNVTVPNVAAGDSPLTVQLGTVKANQTLFVNIGH